MRSARRWIDAAGLRELGLVGAGLLIYFLIRGNVVDEVGEATAHAAGIVHLEEAMGFYWEPRLQQWLGAGLLQIEAWNLIYFWAHAPVIAVVAIWLYLQHRRHYSLIRNAFLVSAVVGLVVYRLYPVAPPRLMTGYGFVDTMQRYSSLSYQAESLKPFVNPYAAVPSLHFGWSFLIGIGLILALRRPLGWVLGLLLPLLMFFAIVATANHFIFDAFAGLGVCLAGLVGAVLLQHWQAAKTSTTTDATAGRADAGEPVRV